MAARKSHKNVSTKRINSKKSGSVENKSDFMSRIYGLQMVVIVGWGSNFECGWLGLEVLVAVVELGF